MLINFNKKSLHLHIPQGKLKISAKCPQFTQVLSEREENVKADLWTPMLVASVLKVK